MAPKRARRAPKASPRVDLVVDDAIVDGDEWADAHVTGDVSGAAVDSLTITGCVLRGVRFTGATLDALRIVDSVLEECDLSGVIAEGIEVVQSELRGCRLDGFVGGRGRFLDVALRESSMRDASLRFTTWQHVELVDVALVRADLTNATFEQVVVERCDLTDAQFWHATLAGTAFPGCRLEAVRGGTAFAGTRLEVAQILDVAPTVFEDLGIELVDG